MGVDKDAGWGLSSGCIRWWIKSFGFKAFGLYHHRPSSTSVGRWFYFAKGPSIHDEDHGTGVSAAPVVHDEEGTSEPK